MKNLSEMYQNNTVSVVTVIGISGIGKSELTNKFGHKVMDERKCSVFVRLNGHSSQSLCESVCCILTQCSGSSVRFGPQKAMKAVPAVEVLQLLIKDFRVSPLKILLVIENVNDLAAYERIRPLLFNETIKDKCFVIVNTNTYSFFDFGYIGEVLHLELLQSSDAEKVIQNNLQSQDIEPSECVKSLAKLLQNFPLALGLATAYIRVQKNGNPNYNVRDYIQEFENYAAETLVTVSEHEHFATTLNAWTVSTRNISQGEDGTAAMELINITAYCEPEVIPLNFLWSFNNQVETVEKMYDTIELLYSYGIVDSDNSALRISRLFQEIVRGSFHSTGTEIEFLKKLVRTINDDLYDALTPNDLAHVQSIWNYAAHNPEIIKEFDKFSDRIADKLHGLQLYMNFLDFSIKYEAMLAEVLGEDHLETMTMESQVAYALWCNGRFDESLAKHKTVHEKQKKLLGECNNLTMITLHNTALVYSRLGKLDDELEIHENLWELKKTNLGADNPNTLLTMERYIECLWQHGSYEIPTNINDFGTALKLFEELIELQARVLPADDSSIVRTKLNWAQRYCGIDRPDRCVQLKREVLAIKERVFGVQHSETIQLKNDIDSFVNIFKDHRLLADINNQPE